MLDDVDRLYERPAANLSAPNIALGFINSVGKNDASGLQNAIQATENAGNARQQEGLRRMEQSERDLAAQVQQQQGQKYAADMNARNMLLAKSNELEGQIGSIKGNWDYSPSSSKYQNEINNLNRQREEINAQLTQATEAVRNNPMYQGETLVNPLSIGAVEQGTNNVGAINALDIDTAMRGIFTNLNKTETNDMTFAQAKNILNKNGITPDPSILTEMEKRFDSAKKEKQGQFSDKEAAVKTAQQQAEDRGNHRNSMLKIQTEFFNNNAELIAAAAKATTQEQFIKNTENIPFISNWAKTSGLSSSDVKSGLNMIFNHIKGNQPPAAGAAGQPAAAKEATTAPPTKAARSKYQ
jgi:hypothetical protein